MSDSYKGLSVDFTGSSPKLNWNETSEDTDTQNILVNIATAKGSDAVYADRGTDLLKKFAESGFVSAGFAQHKANFAAMDTKTFYNVTRGETSRQLNSIVLEVTPLSLQSLQLHLRLGYEGTLTTNIEATL